MSNDRFNTLHQQVIKNLKNWLLEEINNYIGVADLEDLDCFRGLDFNSMITIQTKVDTVLTMEEGDNYYWDEFIDIVDEFYSTYPNLIFESEEEKEDYCKNLLKYLEK